jgi:hypothetical protein
VEKVVVFESDELGKSRAGKKVNLTIACFSPTKKCMSVKSRLIGDSELGGGREVKNKRKKEL